jgi:hypothetical protein
MRHLFPCRTTRNRDISHLKLFFWLFFSSGFVVSDVNSRMKCVLFYKRKEIHTPREQQNGRMSDSKTKYEFSLFRSFRLAATVHGNYATAFSQKWRRRSIMKKQLITCSHPWRLQAHQVTAE